MSRSRLIPGNTSTADFIAALPAALTRHLDPIILDHGVGEQLFGGILQRGLGAGAVGALDLDVEHLALADACDSADAERFQRALDGLALRVENAGFQRDGDAGFHRFQYGRWSNRNRGPDWTKQNPGAKSRAR